MKTVTLILNLVQPLSVLVFLVAGVLSLIVGLKKQGVVDLCIALANFFIFYGDKVIKD